MIKNLNNSLLEKIILIIIFKEKNIQIKKFIKVAPKNDACF